MPFNRKDPTESCKKELLKNLAADERGWARIKSYAEGVLQFQPGVTRRVRS